MHVVRAALVAIAEIVAIASSIACSETIIAVDTRSSATKQAQLPYCDVVKGAPASEYMCQAKDAWRVKDKHPEKEKKISLKQQKKKLDEHAYVRWKTLTHPTISGDGKWVAYALESVSGTPELVVRVTRGAVEYRVLGGKQAHFSADARHLIFKILSVTGMQDSHRIADPASKSALGIMRLPGGSVTTIPGVISFAMQRNSGRYLAYVLKDKDSNVPDRTNVGTLVLRDLDSNQDVTLANVAEYVFDNSERYLAYTISDSESGRDGVYVRRLADGQTTTLIRGRGYYEGLTFDEKGEQLAFIADIEEYDRPADRYTLYYAASPLVPAIPVVHAGAFEPGLEISAEAGVRFTADGNAIIFNVGSLESALPSASSSEAPSLELWHWEDPGTWSSSTDSPTGRMPSQLGAAGPYLTVYHIAPKRLVRLANAKYPEVMLTEDARHAVGISSHAYRLESTWKLPRIDIYLIDPFSGTAQLFRRGLQPLVPFTHDRYSHSDYLRHEYRPQSVSPYIVLSPAGRYMLYFEHERWWSLDLATHRVSDLTGMLLPHVRFEVEEDTDPWAVYGIGAWTTADERVLLYARHDIFEIDPAGRVAPRNLTDGVGARENIIFRLWEDYGHALNSPWSAGRQFLPWDKPFLDSTAEVLLVALDRDTMASGIWRDRLGVRRLPEKLLMLNKRVFPAGKARHREVYLLRMERFDEYPDLWIGPRFDQLRKISDANPQQAEYRWGSGEIVEFTSQWGMPLKGRLYTPEDFNASKRYPMIVSLYTNQRHLFHRYFNPAPVNGPKSHDSWPEATSRGYLHFLPDIVPRPPNPGQSAIAAVVPAVRTLISRGFVEPRRICLTGHSHGGYETNYIITQTDLFRCAVSGAAPANHLSMYGTGRFIASYEIAWVGSSIWESPYSYIENSPIIHANQVVTPVLIMHGQRDRVVPVLQGMEWFYALRRNGRPVWLLNYTDADHQLHKHADKMDFDRRQWQFLDYYLKDAPIPEWMAQRE